MGVSSPGSPQGSWWPSEPYVHGKTKGWRSLPLSVWHTKTAILTYIQPGEERRGRRRRHHHHNTAIREEGGREGGGERHRDTAERERGCKSLWVCGALRFDPLWEKSLDSSTSISIRQEDRHKHTAVNNKWPDQCVCVCVCVSSSVCWRTSTFYIPVFNGAPLNVEDSDQNSDILNVKFDFSSLISMQRNFFFFFFMHFSVSLLRMLENIVQPAQKLVSGVWTQNTEGAAYLQS